MAFETTIPVRFRDLDPMGHVNNAVYATYLEEGRVAFFRDVIGADLSAVDTVLVSLELEFVRPVTDGEVTVRVDVPHLGETSIPMEYRLSQTEQVVATGETVQVVVDDRGESKPIPSEWRERIRNYLSGR